MREPILDLCRFMAAMLVLGRHWLSQQWPVAEALTNIESNNIFFKKLLKNTADLCHVGFLGVHIFFIISGYIIIKSAMNKTPAVFFISRFVRLAPLYIITFIVAALVGGYIFDFQEYHSMKNILLSFSMANFPLNMKGPNGQSWTLWWEIRFYFLIFLVILFANYCKYSQAKLKHLLFVSTLLWLAMVCTPTSNDGFIGVVLIAKFAPFFIFGCLLAFVNCKKDGIFLLPFLILTFTMMSYLVLEEVQSQLNSTSFDGTALVVLLLFVMLLIFNIRFKSIGRCGKFSSVMSMLGKITYPIYLLHMVIMAALIQYLINYGQSVSISIVISFLVMILISLVYVMFVEQPLSNLLTVRLTKSLHSILKD